MSNITLENALFPGVKVWAGREEYDSVNGPAPADDTTKKEKRWTLKSDVPLTLTFVDIENGQAVIHTGTLDPAYLASTNFSGRPAYPKWEAYVAGLGKIGARVINPSGDFFGQPTSREVYPSEYFLFTSSTTAATLAAAIGNGAVAVEQKLLTAAQIVYDPAELRRTFEIVVRGVAYRVGDLLMKAATDPQNANSTVHGGVGQPGTWSLDANGAPVFTQDLSVPTNAPGILPAPVLIPAGYTPVVVKQIGGSVIEFAPVAGAGGETSAAACPNCHAPLTVTLTTKG